MHWLKASIRTRQVSVAPDLGADLLDVSENMNPDSLLFSNARAFFDCGYR